jgi:hypothetical protein
MLGWGKGKERKGKATYTSQTANSTTTRCGATLALSPWCFSLDVFSLCRLVSCRCRCLKSQPWFFVEDNFGAEERGGGVW